MSGEHSSTERRLPKANHLGPVYAHLRCTLAGSFKPWVRGGHGAVPAFGTGRPRGGKTGPLQERGDLSAGRNNEAIFLGTLERQIVSAQPGQWASAARGLTGVFATYY